MSKDKDLAAATAASLKAIRDAFAVPDITADLKPSYTREPVTLHTRRRDKIKQIIIKHPRIGTQRRAVHQLVAAHYYNRKLQPDEDVHHIDTNTANNTPNNLAIMRTCDHKTWHYILKRWHQTGDLIRYADVATQILKTIEPRQIQLAMLRSLPLPLQFIMQSELYTRKISNRTHDFENRTCLTTAHLYDEKT